MLVESVLVEDIDIVGESAHATATLYEFAGGGWVSIHERPGRRIGPMTAVDAEPESKGRSFLGHRRCCGCHHSVRLGGREG